MGPLGISLGYRLANYLYSAPPPFLIYGGIQVSPVTYWRSIPPRLPSNAVALFKDCVLDYHIQNHMKAKTGVDRKRNFFSLHQLLHAIPVFSLGIWGCARPATPKLTVLAKIPAQLVPQWFPGTSRSFSAHVPQMGWDEKVEPTLCSVRRTVRKGSNQSVLVQVDCCSPPGLLGRGQVRCSGRSHSPPEGNRLSWKGVMKKYDRKPLMICSRDKTKHCWVSPYD